MKHRISFLLLFALLSISSFAQREKMSREDKDEKNQARQARINSKNDYALFRRQMVALREFADEKRKVPALQKNNKGPIKIVAVIDSNDNDNDGTSKTLLGYIRRDIADNTTNMYEVVYDRAAKKIISVKRTQEGIDADQEEADENPVQKTTKSKTKTVTKKTKGADDDEEMSEQKTKVKTRVTPKKTKDEDGDDDPDEDRPSKSKQKDAEDE